MIFARALILLLSAMLLSTLANAHEGRPVYIEVSERSADTYELRWKIPPVVADGEEPLIRLSGGGCSLSAGVPRASLVGTHLYRCPDGASGLQIDLRYPGANPVLSTLVLYRGLNGMEQSIMGSPDETSVPLPGTETFWQVATRYTFTGTDHILEGYDHLLFVLCLMLLAGSLRGILITVTGFTLGHSVTLAVSALAGWSLQPAFVEPLIAFSILILAAELAKNKGTTLAYKYPALVATGFGLLHGFGFGGALSEIGLPYGLKIQALAFFNLGVEVGQIIFVLAAYGAYALLARLAGIYNNEFQANQLRVLAVYPTGLVAAYWTFDRLGGIL